MRLLYYVSGHGFGHARRSAQVIREVLRQSPESEVFVRTSAPAGLFAPLPPERVEWSDMDAGMAEHGPLSIDGPGTVDRLRRLESRAAEVLSGEIDAVHRIGPDLLVADIPFLAGQVAWLVDVPCVAVSNFTWDWICEPILAGTPDAERLHRWMQEGYRKMAGVLRLPLGEVSLAFVRQEQTPLIAGRSSRAASNILAELGIFATDERPRVLIAMRGGLPVETVLAAAAEAPEMLFLLQADRIAGAPANLHCIAPQTTPEFSDLIVASDVVVSKLGYGIVSDCIAARKALLWPRRTGFREDAIAEVEGPKHLRMLELPLDAFRAGRWSQPLRALLASPAPTLTAPTDGAAVCAEKLLNWHDH